MMLFVALEILQMSHGMKKWVLRVIRIRSRPVTNMAADKVGFFFLFSQNVLIFFLFLRENMLLVLIRSTSLRHTGLSGSVRCVSNW